MSSSERSEGDPSSSSVKSSSSSVKSSGSSSSKRSAWEYLSPNTDYGEIVDERDGQVYKTVKIGDQWWMAQNLNYEVPNSFCYDDIKSNCDIYGRLYRWSAALGKSDDGCRYGENCPLPDGHIQGACPANWLFLYTERMWATKWKPKHDSEHFLNLNMNRLAMTHPATISVIKVMERESLGMTGILGTPSVVSRIRPTRSNTRSSA